MELTLDQKRAIAIAQAKQQQAQQQEQAQTIRTEMLNDLASDVGFMENLGVNIGRGFTNVARGFGFAEPEDELSRQAMGALRNKRPISSTIGEIVGETAPFIVPGGAVAKVASVPARVAGSGVVGATEGAVLANAKDQDVVSGALTGLSIGAGFEAAAPFIGRLGRQLVSRITGKAPTGSLLDNAGRPTEELQGALNSSGITFDELTQDAQTFIANQRTGADPEQVARAAEFQSLGIPASRSDITQNFAEQATEQRLLQSASDKVAEPFRQFKLRQSETIKQRLTELTPNNPLPEETGELIKESLIGRKKLLRTQKNALYQQAAESADDVGGVMLFTDNLRAAVPDPDTFEDIAITAPQAAQSLQGILKRYGIIDPTPEEIQAGFQSVPLDLKSFERFRKSLNAIERGDTTGAASVIVGPIKEALDLEVSELSETLAAQGVSENVIGPLREARKIVRQMKTEFSPQSITGRLVDTKKDGVTNIIEASSAYNKLAAKSMPVENVRKVVSSLKSSGQSGREALASMQATTMLDLVDAGFSTQSRKIDGVGVFNPTAFRKRMDQVGRDKLKAIFSDNPKALERLNNIEKIAKAVTPSADAVPKGSAAVLQDTLNRLGIIGITSKIPGGGLLIEAITSTAGNASTRRQVSGAMKPQVEVRRIRNIIDESLPSISAAAGIAYTQQPEQPEQ